MENYVESDHSLISGPAYSSEQLRDKRSAGHLAGLLRTNVQFHALQVGSTSVAGCILCTESFS